MAPATRTYQKNKPLTTRTIKRDKKKEEKPAVDLFDQIKNGSIYNQVNITNNFKYNSSGSYFQSESNCECDLKSISLIKFEHSKSDKKPPPKKRKPKERLKNTLKDKLLSNIKENFDNDVKKVVNCSPFLNYSKIFKESEQVLCSSTPLVQLQQSFQTRRHFEGFSQEEKDILKVSDVQYTPSVKMSLCVNITPLKPPDFVNSRRNARKKLGRSGRQLFSNNEDEVINLSSMISEKSEVNLLPNIVVQNFEETNNKFNDFKAIESHLIKDQSLNAETMPSSSSINKSPQQYEEINPTLNDNETIDRSISVNNFVTVRNRRELKPSIGKNENLDKSASEGNFKINKEIVIRLERHKIPNYSPKAENSLEKLSNHRFDLLENQHENSTQESLDVTESSAVDKDYFKHPLPFKKIQLKAGKLWRRSLNEYKHNQRKSTNLQDPITRRSKSIFRIVPLPLLQETLNNSSCYVCEEEPENFIEKQLEGSFRGLSLNNRNTVFLDAPLNTVTAKEIVLRRCRQTEPLSFDECYPSSALKNCQKIGEGVFGEVFLYRNGNGDTTVMKIVPIEGKQMINGEKQKKYEEILSEILISMELSNLRFTSNNSTKNFTEVKNVKCVIGAYPKRLIDLWDLYDETRNSENDSPTIFTPDQVYIVLELANGGVDLEAFVFNNALQAYSMFQQVACALAVAENQLNFEHRDLHWGNVLLSHTNMKTVEFSLENVVINVDTHGIFATIIDFTLSRMEFEGVVIYNDLAADEDLFNAQGDYQFDIYRAMQEKNGNDWQHFEPVTNILWLHYILDKAITALRYKNKKSKIHNKYLEKLIYLKENILSCYSTKEFILTYFV